MVKAEIFTHFALSSSLIISIHKFNMASQTSSLKFQPEYPRFASQTKELRKDIADAIEQIPQKQYLRPATGETCDILDDAFIRIKDCNSSI